MAYANSKPPLADDNADYREAVEAYGLEKANDPSRIKANSTKEDVAMSHPANMKASESELGEARERICTIAAGRVFFHPFQDGAVNWAQNQASGLKALDAMFAAFLPLLTATSALMTDEVFSSPEELAQNTKAHVATLVLATVYCPAWRLSWITGFMMLVLTHFRCCSILQLLSVKGGPNTDCEIRFVEEAMRLMGFTPKRFRVCCDRFTNSDGKYLPCLWWQWTIEREGAEEYKVNLYQYDSIQQANPEYTAFDLRAMEEDAKSPSLRRVAVISMPLTDKNGDSHEQFNEKLMKGLGMVMENAKTKGWCPPGSQGVGNMKTFREKFLNVDSSMPETAEDSE